MSAQLSYFPVPDILIEYLFEYLELFLLVQLLVIKIFALQYDPVVEMFPDLALDF